MLEFWGGGLAGCSLSSFYCMNAMGLVTVSRYSLSCFTCLIGYPLSLEP